MQNVMTDAALKQEGLSLVESGDLIINNYRTYYKIQYGRETTLTDEQVILMVMKHGDDDEPSGWATTMYELETKALVDSHS